MRRKLLVETLFEDADDKTTRETIISENNEKKAILFLCVDPIVKKNYLIVEAVSKLKKKNVPQ